MIRRVQRTWMDRRRRQVARLALYGSLLLVGGLAWILVSFLGRTVRLQAGEGDWYGKDFASLPEVQLLQQYVRIDTSETTGDEAAGARFLAAQLEAAGIPARVEVLGGKHANVYGFLKGEDPRPLVLHHHIDVQPADPKEWIHPPYEARLDLPWIYGRGVFDMKSIAIAQLMAVLDLKKSGVPLKRSVLFLGTSGEERGSHLGAIWLLRQHPEMVRNFWAVLTEGGVLEARARNDIKWWGVEFAQKRFFDLTLCGDDRAQLEQTRKDLIEWRKIVTVEDLRLTDEARTLFAAYGPTRDDPELRQLLASPERLVTDLAAFRELPPYLQSMLRNEPMPFPVEAAPGGGFRLVVKLHLLPGQELDDATVERLVPSWMTAGLPRTIERPPLALHGSPVDHPALRETMAVMREHYPEAAVGPYLLPWSATDSRFFRRLGVPSYGFSPFLIMSTDTLSVDEENERLGLPGYVEGVEIYRELVRRLVTGRR